MCVQMDIGDCFTGRLKSDDSLSPIYIYIKQIILYTELLWQRKM